MCYSGWHREPLSNQWIDVNVPITESEQDGTTVMLRLVELVKRFKIDLLFHFL
jgi:hypothetical protein